MSGQSRTHWLEVAAASIAFRGFGAMPIDRASALGGWIGRKLGQVSPVTKRARRNLARFLPELGEDERERIVSAMWDNLGRNAAEFAHLGEFDVGGRIELVDADYLPPPDAPGPRLFVTAHTGNWELSALAVAQLGFHPLSVVYRAASNQDVDWIFRAGREAMGVGLIPKGAQGARMSLKLLKEGGNLGLLVDQKMNDGIAVPFFGTAAMTAPALAVFALKYRCPVFPVRIVRQGGARFRALFEPPMEVRDSGNREADVLDLMTRVNAMYERWIRERPAEWLWLHNRWPDPPRQNPA